MSEEDGRTFGGTLPYDDVSSGEVDLAGRFAEMVHRLAYVLDRLAGPQPVTAWIDALVTGTELLAVSAPPEKWQGEQLRRVLAEVAEQAAPPAVSAGGSTAAHARPELSLAEVRDLLDSRLQGRPTRANAASRVVPPGRTSAPVI
jgi:exodeoxyribonuclease V gamma subunit